MVNIKGIYSVDMVRLKARVLISDFQPFVQSLMSNPQVDYWENRKISAYKHNLTYSVDVRNDSYHTKYSYYLAYRHNMEKPGLKFSLVLEYNPNKCEDDIMLALIKERFFKGNKIEVVSADVAIDFRVGIRQIVIDRGGKRIYKYFESPNDGITHYYGSGGTGQVKVYNKTAEAGLKYDLTRYEVRVGVDLLIQKISFLNVKMDLPEVHILSTQMTIDMLNDKTLMAMLYAVGMGYPVNSLSRVYRDKIKPLSVSDKFEISEISIADTIKDYVRKTFS